jgi:alanyl-tRNA synthetase
MMTSAQVREAFLKYFERQGHTIVPSSSLVPDDPTLLFTNAGMVQFKDAFLGLEKRAYTRATTAQKCMRVSGKHNDLENVGPSPRHHTFFEMLGNFSFGGDYFKAEAIRFAHEFVTEELGIPPERLRYTVHVDDDEAYGYWLEMSGVRPEQVYRMGDVTNFWMMGDTGPCGPTSELHYDWGTEACTCGDPECSVLLDNGCDRWLEIWNLVFMQFDQTADGTRTPLPKPGVDTGMGLERIVSVMQGVRTNYETDLFAPILDRVQQLLGHTDAQREEGLVAYRVIADHSRAMTFLIADGVLPGNEGRRYVLRMIMRRAMRFGKKLGFDGPFLGQVAETVIHLMGGHYTELVERRDFILEAIAQEEERFQRTLETGLTILDRVIAEVEAAGQVTIPGREAFRLYDTYGFPFDLTRDIAEEHGLTVDRAGFDQAMAEQKARARAAQKFGVADIEAFYRQLELPKTAFLGYDYDRLTSEARVLALVRDGELVEVAEEGQMVEIVLDQSPFYAEAGGQVGDTGGIRAGSGQVTVTATEAPIPGLIVHRGRVEEGVIQVGQTVEAAVDQARRWDIMRNHTATHLLHRALHVVLGEHALQQGSLVAPDRLRFDFTHLSAVTREELTRIEEFVNEAIRADYTVTWRHLPFDEARRAGAVALFGEKYGDVVRMVTVGEGEVPERGYFSRELCGGTHVLRTGQIGFLAIVSESSIAAGVRRVEAVTGRGAEEWARGLAAQLEQAARVIGAPPAEVAERAEKLVEQLDAQRKEIARLRRELAKRQADALLGQVRQVDGVPVVAGQVDAADVDGLREMTDWIRQRLGSAVVVLGTVIEGRPQLVAAVTPDLVDRGYHAGRLVNAVAGILGGRGGGRPNMAQAGGGDPGRLPDALARVAELVRDNGGAE